MGPDEIRSLLVELALHPGDAALRRRVAEALDDHGSRDDLGAVLAPLVNLTGHDDDAGLPCLCTRCLPGAGTAAEASGMQFERSFAIVGTRVLHYWQLAAQKAERANVRASVTAALRARLEPRK